MVDCESQIIIAQHVTAEANDVQHLESMLERSTEVNGEPPEKLLADAGTRAKPTKQWRTNRRSCSSPPPKIRNVEKNTGRRDRHKVGSRSGTDRKN